MAKKRPAKITDVRSQIIQAVNSGEYLDVTHAQDRSRERNITRPEYEYVLKNCFHERSKDEYMENYKAWNYAVRGHTIDGRDIRVVVSFDDNGMLIITVIDLEK
ncbi:MAG: DUF4258 domain-containing protein [Planctomycetes bacterium]|nr:DUF4258 domain-containing protein [Planctomycetota bacterium]